MKFATCNEPWRDVPIEEVLRIAAGIGVRRYQEPLARIYLKLPENHGYHLKTVDSFLVGLSAPSLSGTLPLRTIRHHHRAVVVKQHILHLQYFNLYRNKVENGLKAAQKTRAINQPVK